MPSTLTSKYLTQPSFVQYIQDLNSNPLATLFSTPKIIHNTLQHVLAPVRDMLGIGKFFDMIGTVLAPVFGDKKDRVWFTNYFMFGSWINLLKLIKPTPNFPVVGNHFWGGIIGAFIQGYDQCKWQQEIGKYPKAAAIVGFANGVACCYMQSLAMAFFGNLLPQNTAIAKTLGFIITWAISSKVMCKIEEVSFKTIDSPKQMIKEVGARFQNMAEAKSEKSCCHQRRVIS